MANQEKKVRTIKVLTSSQMSVVTRKAKKLVSILDQMEKLKEESDKLKDDLREILGVDEEMETNLFKISNIYVTSNKINTSLLKKELPIVYNKYVMSSTSRRFECKAKTS